MLKNKARKFRRGVATRFNGPEPSEPDKLVEPRCRGRLHGCRNSAEISRYLRGVCAVMDGGD